jgi:hypothetical protein
LEIVQQKFSLAAPKPHINRAPKLISNKRKPEKTRNLPSWIFKKPTIDMIFGAMQRDN